MTYGLPYSNSSILLDEILQEKLQVEVQWDKEIKLPELKKKETPVYVKPPTGTTLTSNNEAKVSDDTILLGKLIKDTSRPISSFEDEEKFVTVEGRIFGLDVRELRKGKQLLSFKITDEKDSILCKVIKESDEIKELKGKKFKGKRQYSYGYFCP